MFEGIVANVLNKILGDYVANLETRQLNIGIWQGWSPFLLSPALWPILQRESYGLARSAPLSRR